MLPKLVEFMKMCPYCKSPIHRSLKPMVFTEGNSPIHSFEATVAVEWCDSRNCYSRVQLYNCIDRMDDDFIHRVLQARDIISPVVSGQITRGCRVSQYDASPGTRPTKLKDARALCTTAVERLNVAVNEWMERIF